MQIRFNIDIFVQVNQVTKNKESTMKTICRSIIITMSDDSIKEHPSTFVESK